MNLGWHTYFCRVVPSDFLVHPANSFVSFRVRGAHILHHDHHGDKGGTGGGGVRCFWNSIFPAKQTKSTNQSTLIRGLSNNKI